MGFDDAYGKRMGTMEEAEYGILDCIFCADARDLFEFSTYLSFHYTDYIGINQHKSVF